MNRVRFVIPFLLLIVLISAGSLDSYVQAAQSSQYSYVLWKAEIYTDAESGELVREVYFSDRGNKQLGGDFVPALSLDGTTNITYYVDNSRPSADVSAGDSEAAISRAMGTWDAQNCSNLGVTKIPYDGRSTGFVAAVFGYGGSLNYAADVLHAGWMPGSFFDRLAPDGSTFILGVTFTIVFTDANGDLVDTDNNGKYDVAWREIYYNDAFTWAINARFDIETIALHEAGHGLSQAHFGEAFRDPGSSTLHFNPRSVMNAAYSGIQQQLAGTDAGGHCSNWGGWPNN